MKTISHSELLTKLAGLSGTGIVGIEALTDSRARKNPFGSIFKHFRFVGFVGANYQNAVKREGERQEVTGEFKAAPLPWGQWVIPNKVKAHKGELYLRTQSAPRQRENQPARMLAYRSAEGKFLSPEEVRPFIPAPSVSRKQDSFGLQDAENQIHVRDFKFSSIRKIRINGETFSVKKDLTDERECEIVHEVWSVLLKNA